MAMAATSLFAVRMVADAVNTAAKEAMLSL
jgi:hypothetical protein